MIQRSKMIQALSGGFSGLSWLPFVAVSSGGVVTMFKGVPAEQQWTQVKAAVQAQNAHGRNPHGTRAFSKPGRGGRSACTLLNELKC